MGNEGNSKVVGKWNAFIIFTSRKTVTLTNVLHVPDMNMNLVSRNLLRKSCTKSVYESEKFNLLENVILCTVDNIINHKIDFVYLVVSFTLWHARLDHIGTSTMKIMLNCDMISYDVNNAYKCKTCVESKMVKKLYQSVKRTSQILELIHSDTCKLNCMLTRDENRYFITFIDDHSRYTYVY